ncbi:hypothetical protein HZC07_00290 [Candidatus Micrarchaeota archaeon]|nr:hypothetical protein [Candidatus Micrarchaeota archaeon]
MSAISAPTRSVIAGAFEDDPSVLRGASVSVLYTPNGASVQSSSSLSESAKKHSDRVSEINAALARLSQRPDVPCNLTFHF